MRLIYLIVTYFVLVITSSTNTLAAPNCNQVAYGSSCFRCAGWANMANWNGIACSHDQATAGGFACSIANCGFGGVHGPVQSGAELKKIPRNSSGLPH